MNKNTVKTVVDMSALKAAFESTQVQPVSVVNTMLDMFSLEFAEMDEVKAHRDEAARLGAILVSLKHEYDVLVKHVALSNSKMFSIGKKIARAKDEAAEIIATNPDLQALETFLKGKGKADRWNTVRLDAINTYVQDVVGTDIDDLNLIKENAPKLLNDVDRLKKTIEQTQDIIERELQAANDLSK